MRLAASCYTKMIVQLGMLKVAVCLAAQSMLGHFPTEAFQVDIVGGMLAKFQEQAEQCLYLENSGSRVANLLLGLADDRVWLTVRLEEAAE
jgi:hypothetical protein